MEVSQNFCPSLKLSWLFVGGGKRAVFLLQHLHPLPFIGGQPALLSFGNTQEVTVDPFDMASRPPK